MIEVSSGDLPIEDTFVRDTELDSWILSLRGDYDEIKKDCKAMLGELSVAGMKLPLWWRELQPKTPENVFSGSDRLFPLAAELIRNSDTVCPWYPGLERTLTQYSSKSAGAQILLAFNMCSSAI